MSDNHDNPQTRVAFDQLRHDTAAVVTLGALRQLEDRRRPRWFGPAILGTAATVVLVIIGLTLWAGDGGDEQVATVTDSADGGESGVTAETLDGTAWILESGFAPDGEISLVDGFPITLTFRGQELGGTAACNGYGASWQTDGSTFAIAGLSWTEIGCQPEVMESEARFLGALQDVDTITASTNELRLTGPSTEVSFQRDQPVPTAELVDQLWLLDGLIQGEAISSTLGRPATLLLNADGTLEGGTGCRSLTGAYVISGASVLFTSFSAGDGSCPGDLRTQDNIVVTVLGDGFTVEIDGDRLVLTSQGNEGLTYVAIAEFPDEAADRELSYEDLDGTDWLLFEGVGPEGEIPQVEGFPITLAFDGAVLRGSGGCNDYGADFTLDANSIVVGPVEGEQEGCNQPVQVQTSEDAYLIALGSINRVSLDGDFMALTGPSTELNFQRQPSEPIDTESVRDEQITVSELLDRQSSEPVAVIGHLLDSGGGWILCDQLSSDSVPRCASRWVVVTNLELLLAADGVEDPAVVDGPINVSISADVSWTAEPIVIDGALREDGRLSVAAYPSNVEPTAADEELLNAYTSLSEAGVSPTTADLRLSANGVALGLGDELKLTRSPDELADPANWRIDAEDFRARVGPFSALELLVDAGDVTTLIGPHDHCAAPPIPIPDGLDDARHLSIEPLGTSSCLDWWAVDLFLDDAGDVVAISLDLWEP